MQHPFGALTRKIEKVQRTDKAKIDNMGQPCNFGTVTIDITAEMDFKSPRDSHILKLRVPKYKSGVLLLFIHQNSANNSSQGFDCNLQEEMLNPGL